MPRTYYDLTGKRFGDLTVIERAGTKDGNAMWRCRCACGSDDFIARGTILKQGKAKSCGCKRNNPYMVYAYVDADLYDFVDEQCEAKGWSRSKLIRVLITNYKKLVEEKYGKH